MVVVFNSEDKNRIKEQVLELWAEKCEGMKLIGIRYDQTVEVHEDVEYPSIALIWIEEPNEWNGSGRDMYLIGWGEVSRSDEGLLQFTADDLESWSESGIEPWYGNKEEYEALIADVYPENPEWEHEYI
jgi:hypothetical protein